MKCAIATGTVTFESASDQRTLLDRPDTYPRNSPQPNRTKAGTIVQFDTDSYSMISWRGGRALSGALIAAFAALFLILITSPAQSRKRARQASAPSPTETATPTAVPTPEVKTWDFDQDQKGQVAKGWTAVEGDWIVIGDPGAPSAPSTFGLGPGRFLWSLYKMLEYYPITVVSDPAEYDDFTLEASFKAVGGRLDCSGGLIARYVDPNNYYVLVAGCPSDYFALTRVSAGASTIIKQSVVPIDKNVWYQLRLVASGEHFSCYANNKMVFDAADSKIAKGRIGLWARADAQVRFDNVKLTLPPKQAEAAPPESPAAPSGSESAPPPLPKMP
ncbi:MAG TPA: family 16 glycoside hydrolase [Candidatus Binataceae bacterium]|nr:family 16 glycoside hydrolase [Candidatus Binataceae bacterium]